MGIPVLYQGSKYAPVPFVPIPPDVTPPSGGPQFSSAEIGTVNASTLVVTFDQDVTAAENDYGLGVTIKVNGVSTSISGGIRQANHAIVYYGIPVLWHGSGDIVTWEYNSAVGIIVAESGGAALGDVTAQSVTNNCEYASLLDLQADTLALNDGDPVSTWADSSGNGRDFTQTGTARPTKQTVGGYSTVSFDGVNDWMTGDNWPALDNLDSFDVITLANINSNTSNIFTISKVGSSHGWELESSYLSLIDGLTDRYEVYDGDHYDEAIIATSERVSGSNIHMYVNGSNLGETVIITGTVTSISNSSPVILAAAAVNPTSPTMMLLYMASVYSPIPNAANRAALETRLGARYGLIVP